MAKSHCMNVPLPFDPELLRRYDRPGPRYTSYPTAPHFTSGFGADQLRQHVQRSNEQPVSRPLSLYVHIPYCFSPCFYCGCNRVITRDPDKGDLYLRRLQRESALLGAMFDSNRPVVQLHLGGGTPNFLRPEQLAVLLATLRSHFNLTNGITRDFSIELDPRYLRSGDLEQLADLGFNRASFGVQDFDPDVQRAVNRIQGVEQTLEAIAACRRHGFRSVNVDLIYGLPRQTREGFARTLETLLAVRPDRCAVYGYAHLPKLFKAQRQIDPLDLPNAAGKLQLLQLAVGALGASGYRYIGMDHFALPEDELAQALANGSLHRNFMGYTTHADCDLVGLGVSAISHVGNSYWQNERELWGWEAAVDAQRLPVWRGLELDRDDQLRAAVIQQLMCTGQIDIGALERRFEIDFASYFADSLRLLHPLATDGLVTVAGGFIAVTPRGRLLVRAVAMCFDRYLHATQPHHFSKVV